MPDRIPELMQALTHTEDTLKVLGGKVNFQQATLRRVKRTTVVGIIGLILDITLTVLVGWGLFGVNDNQARVNQLQSALQQQTDRDTTAQCAVVQLFLSLQGQVQKNPNYTADQRAIQEQAFTTLSQIGQRLECPK